MLDVIIIGGGPAGLSAALMLGRCRRAVAVVDAGQRRNSRARAMNGYLTRDGISPRVFIRQAVREAQAYGVEIICEEAVDASRRGGGAFRVATASGRVLESRKLLFATGVRDLLPRIPGISDFYGVSVHHCPYCDGWEHRDQRLVAFGPGPAAVGLALSLRTWSRRVAACTDGVRLGARQRERCKRNGIAIREEAIAGLEGTHGRLERVKFTSGRSLACDAMFFNTGQLQRSMLPRGLGCELKDDGGFVTDIRQGTGIPGLYLAGDAEKEVQFVIVAAAEGAVAAVAINRELQDEDRGEGRRRIRPAKRTGRPLGGESKG